MVRAITMALGTAFLAVTVGFSQSPAGNFAVTPQVGPWMILVASYRGEDARVKAEEMCQELRSRKIPTYAFNRAAEEKQKEAERVAGLREQHKQQLRAAGLPEDTPLRIKTIRIEDQYAVLVGGFKDDTIARKYLDDVRKLKASEGLQQSAYVPGPDGKMREQAVNPFQSAFVCRNPTMPVDKAGQNDAPNPRLKEYNAGESFSLLKCPQPWTLVVNTFTGAAIVQGQNAPKSLMEKILSPSKSQAMLNANSNQAHLVAELLKKLGYEVYVLHTEYSSYVTIGSFASANDSRLLELQQLFVNELKNPKSYIGAAQLNGQIQFLPNPMPMPVPQLK
jgi:hypothetical protein